MSLRQIFHTMIRRVGPIMYATNIYFSGESELKKPTAEDKLKFEPLDIIKLTNEYMVQQSAINVVNSATQALTVTYMTIMRTSTEYKSLLNELIALSKEMLQYEVNDEHWDMMLDLRSKMQIKKESLDKLTGYMEYVRKMAVSATEMSYLSGLDSLSITLSQRIDDAVKNIQEEVDNVTKLEREYCYVQEQCIRNSNKTAQQDSTTESLS